MEKQLIIISFANTCKEEYFTYLLMCCNICCFGGLCNFVLIYIVWNVLQFVKGTVKFRYAVKY